MSHRTKFFCIIPTHRNHKPLPSSTWDPADGDKCIGGYSITSIPASLPQFELAIQSSRHPVAGWATARALPNDVVDVRVGGTFTYEGNVGSTNTTNDDNGDGQRLLFIVGGVGINPLLSMIRQWNADWTTEERRRNGEKTSRAMLLYSCGTMEDLLFVPQLDELVGERPDRFRVVCTTTHRWRQQRMSEDQHDGGKVIASGNTCIDFREGRIDETMVNTAVGWLNDESENGIMASGEAPSWIDNKNENAIVADAIYVCGPPGMPESMMKILLDGSLVQSEEDVHFEKWW